MIVTKHTGFLSDWKWFPVGLLGALAVVFAVNGYLVYAALSTFPGEAGQDGFDLSNAYGRVLDLSARQTALGWHVRVEAGADGHAVVVTTDKAGRPLQGARVQARAERPVGPKQETALIWQSAGQSEEPGRLVSQQSLAAGQWTVLMTIGQGDDTLSTTSRLTLR